MKLIYPALFHKEDGAVWAEFPDLEGCQTYGENANETLKLAQEALEGYALPCLKTAKACLLRLTLWICKPMKTVLPVLFKRIYLPI